MTSFSSLEHLNSNNSPFRFNAKELDCLSREAVRFGKETGNYYYGARYGVYPEHSRRDPKWSIWISVDPLAEEMPEWSSYAYTFNNPVNFTDPTGMVPEGGGTPSNPCDQITTEVNGEQVTYQPMRVHVRNFTVSPTEDGGYSEFEYTGEGSYEWRFKSDNEELNNYYGPNESRYTVYEEGSNEPIIISTQTEKSTTVAKTIREKYNPYSENLARAYEDTGERMSDIGEVSLPVSILAGLATVPATVIGLTGFSMELKANNIRNRNDKNYKKTAAEVASQTGSYVVNKKTKSKYIRAAYEATASSIKKIF